MKVLRHFGVWLTLTSLGLMVLFSVMPDGRGWSIYGLVMAFVGGYAVGKVASNIADLLAPMEDGGPDEP